MYKQITFNLLLFSMSNPEQKSLHFELPESHTPIEVSGLSGTERSDLNTWELLIGVTGFRIARVMDAAEGTIFLEPNPNMVYEGTGRQEQLDRVLHRMQETHHPDLSVVSVDTIPNLSSSARVQAENLEVFEDSYAA